jgi:DeoR/GlpR family transcriptional regulator of sugar metabolism
VPSLIGAAAETYVLASAEKLGAASPYMVTNLNGVTGIITEKSVDDALLQPFVAAGLTLLRA